MIIKVNIASSERADIAKNSYQSSWRSLSSRPSGLFLGSLYSFCWRMLKCVYLPLTTQDHSTLDAITAPPTIIRYIVSVVFLCLPLRSRLYMVPMRENLVYSVSNVSRHNRCADLQNNGCRTYCSPCTTPPRSVLYFRFHCVVCYKQKGLFLAYSLRHWSSDI